MDSYERLAGYLAARTPKQQLVVLTPDNRLLTPAMRRRLRKKERSRKTHSHQGLPVVEVSKGVFRRVPCDRCHHLPRPKLIGG